jgi:non-specific serine/threonine protein kinase
VTRFVGREREIAEVEQLLSDTHFLTLTGSGGCGKTRLALQVAADQVERFPDGVWLVDLAPLTDPTLVPEAIARVLGIHEIPDLPLLSVLVQALRSRDLLLLLDNCEHLLESCARVVDNLLQRCPSVWILATRREALRVAGEVKLRVPSLAVPPAEEPPAPTDLVRFDAVRLFVDRAESADPSFAVTAANAPTIAKICRRLDGIPLALELAAARTSALTVEQIAARLDQRFRLLTGGSRAALRRQQTLSAMVGWSYELLSEPERMLFNRLGVFVGGFTLEAAETVGSDQVVQDPETERQSSPISSLPQISRLDVLDLLMRLVEKSLVLAELGEEGANRYRLLETLR